MTSVQKIRLDRLLANLGYVEGRSGVKSFLRDHEVCLDGAPLRDAAQGVDARRVTIDGQPLDPLPGFVLMLNKPAGYECTHAAAGAPIVYDLLPPRFLFRKPQVVSVGRLDKDTTGLLLITDDGQVVQRLAGPRHHVAKTYDVTLRDRLKGHEGAAFAEGKLMLRGEDKPLLPAVLEVIDETHARLTITEGRYHQVKRMFAAMENEVIQLHRSAFGALALGDLPQGQWRFLSEDEMAAIAR